MKTILEEEFFCKGIMPVYSTAKAACADVAIPYDVTVQPRSAAKVDLMIRFKDLSSHITMYPRSSLLIKHSLLSPTSIIDADYEGCIHWPVYNPTEEPVTLEAGTRVAQLLYEHDSDWERKEAVRGDGGFGSTGI